MKAVAYVKLADGQSFETDCILRENKYTHATLIMGLSIATFPEVKEITIKVLDSALQTAVETKTYAFYD